MKTFYCINCRETKQRDKSIGEVLFRKSKVMRFPDILVRVGVEHLAVQINSLLVTLYQYLLIPSRWLVAEGFFEVLKTPLPVDLGMVHMEMPYFINSLTRNYVEPLCVFRKDEESKVLFSPFLCCVSGYHMLICYLGHQVLVKLVLCVFSQQLIRINVQKIVINHSLCNPNLLLRLRELLSYLIRNLLTLLDLDLMRTHVNLDR